MADVDKRAELLASTALGLFGAGRLEDAARALREAIHIAPQNAQVRAAFQRVQETQDAGSRIPDLVRKLLEDASVPSGDEAVKILRAGGSVTSDQAGAIVLAIVQYDGGDDKVRATAGRVLSALLHASNDGKTAFIALVVGEEMRARIFDRVLRMGADAVDAVTSITIDGKAWQNGKHKTQQTEVTKSWFRYLLSHLDAAKADLAIRPLSRLLAADASSLHPLVGESEFLKLLTLISRGAKEDVRTGALLAAAKYLESIDASKALRLLADFLTTRIASDDDDDMALAFSVAAALFPVATSTLANLFHTDGFIQSLVPSLRGRSLAVELAAIDLMSAACVDKTCRDAIAKHCEPYLKSIAAAHGDGSPAASLALAKLSGDTPATAPGEKKAAAPAKSDKEVEALAATFTKLLSTADAASQLQSVEGLAYTSLTPSVKESLAADTPTLKSLLALLTTGTSPSVVFGVLTTVDNLSCYTTLLTEEQRKMAQLKNYANAAAQKSLETHKLDTDAYVTKRCKALLDAGVVPALVRLAKKTSPQATALTSSILLSLSKITAHRGAMAQQGAVRLLLQIHASLPSPPKPKPGEEPDESAPPTVDVTTSHALSRLLISVNPTLAFSASLPITSAVPPILALIETVHGSTAETRDLLPLFEGLLALTNLASTTDSIRQMIVRKEFSTIEELLVYRNDMVQRAAVELVCNLMVSPETVALFSEGPRSGNRLGILLAVAQADDVPSRMAAGGALAMLTEWDAGVRKLVEREGAVERVLEICEDDEDGVVFRGVVVARNLVMVGGDGAKDKVKKAGGVEVLKRVLEEAVAQGGEESEVVSVAVEALQALVK
ncbi:hypothetical protein Dda_6824 [Drechslerella dactyloides]|uniref:UNC-45/Cro1/She4 central domain-containing protein n=1 Tax=Drechslerella dactyloides TaxID=74499 RepID=A0AAD6IUP7_DREDA|nr:hypothetical protein Dda_6824 [Drechslerella dactyloides]